MQVFYGAHLWNTNREMLIKTFASLSKTIFQK